MKLKVDQSDITLGELAQVEEQLGSSLSVAFDKSQARAIAALAWITKRREDINFSFEEALNLRMSDLDIVTPDPKVQDNNNGEWQLELQESGD